MPQVNFRVTDEQYKALAEQAHDLGIKSVPELCKQYSTSRKETALEDRKSFRILIQVRRLLNQHDLDDDTLEKINEELDKLCHT